MSTRLTPTVVAVRRVVLAILALGVLFGLAAMHDLTTVQAPAMASASARMEQAMQQPAAAASTTVTADPSTTGSMSELGQCMDACCVALAAALVLATLAGPGVLGEFIPLRPNVQPPAPASRVLPGLHGDLTLGVLRI